MSVHTFLRGVHVVEYDERALRAVADHLVTLAEVEDLPAHGAAIQTRLLCETGDAGDKRPIRGLSSTAMATPQHPSHMLQIAPIAEKLGVIYSPGSQMERSGDGP